MILDCMKTPTPSSAVLEAVLGGYRKEMMNEWNV